MTVRDALREGVAALAGSGTPFLDASLILAEAMGREAGSLYASGPEELDAGQLGAFRLGVERRAAGLPVAYILGRREFYGRSFSVDRRVLVPRPETELLVEAALACGDALAGSGWAVRLHDAFTGSGCVAISLAAERPGWEVSASDASEAALEVASANASRLLPPGRPGGPLRLELGDLLGAAPAGAHIVTANPPYVPAAEAEALLAGGWGEPAMALDGGADGLDLVRRLVAQAPSRLAPGGFLLVEADGSQAAELRRLFDEAGLVDVASLADLSGAPRVTRGRASP